MSSSIQNLLQTTLGDVARSTKYSASFSFTDSSSGISQKDLVVMGKTSSFPSKSHSIIDFKHNGRTIPIKGQTKFSQSWECTFHLTEDHRLKIALETWVEALDQTHNYMQVSDVPNLLKTQTKHNSSNVYTTTVTIEQLDFSGKKAQVRYTLHNAFPIVLTPVQTSHETVSSTQELSVTFAYSHFTTESYSTENGNFIDNLIGKVQNNSSSIINNTVNNKIPKIITNPSSIFDVIKNG